MTDTSSGTVLVIGATGKTGRRVVERLQERSVPVRRGSRSASPAFDWTEPEGWPAVVDGVRACYITYHPDLALPGAGDAVAAFTRVAVDAGVERIVMLAGRGEPEAEEAEEAVRAVDPNVTIVRSTWFAQNFSEDYMCDLVLSGVVALPAGDTPEPFVDADDIADVVTTALLEAGHEGRRYVLTGPRPLTFAEAIAEIASATGRSIEYRPITIEDHETAARANGVPDDVVGMLTYLFAEVLDGRNSHIEHGVFEALGRPPTDFSEYARKAAAAGAWNVPSPPLPAGVL